MSFVHLFKKWNIGILAYLTNEWDNLKNLKILREVLIFLDFLNCLIHFFIILGIFGYWVIGAGCLIEKDLGYTPISQVLAYINWASLVTSWFVVQKLYSKMHLHSCTKTHCDITDLVYRGMVKNKKIWISWEQNILFLWNKKMCALDGTFWEVIVL